MALVLSRKSTESITCELPSGEEIRFTLGEIRGEKVRIVIEAPRTVKVLRSELRSVGKESD
jgi:carbon storage regulator CsrA